jgi:hypothetical protein
VRVQFIGCEYEQRRVNKVEPLLKEAEELTAIFTSSRKTASTRK